MSNLRMPNQSLYPTAVGAVSSAIAVHVTGRRWFNFFRSLSVRMNANVDLTIDHLVRFV